MGLLGLLKKPHRMCPIFVMAAFLLPGCSDPSATGQSDSRDRVQAAIDASNSESFQDSVVMVRRELSKEDAALLDRYIAESGIAAAFLGDSAEVSMRTQIDGLTAGQLSVALNNGTLIDLQPAEERIAQTTLRSSVAMAQEAFVSGAYVDSDGDGDGEYGWISQLTGASPSGTIPAGEIKLMSPDMNETSEGYRLVMYLPTNSGWTTEAEEVDSLSPAAVDRREQEFICYAWPEDPSHHVFVITESGQVYQSPNAKGSSEPRWWAAFAELPPASGKRSAPLWSAVE